MAKEIKHRPKHHKLALLVERRLQQADQRCVHYFRNPENTICILDEMGLLRPGLGKKSYP